MKIMIIDGNSIINRAFYGIRLLSTASGEYTNAVYGFFTTYLRLFEDIKPDGVCVCFDLKAPTFRHKEFDVYKAGRHPMPDELAAQIPLTKEALDLMGVPRFELSGYEADDLIGTISRIAAQDGNHCFIVTGDRDSLQLVDDNVTVKLITTKGGQTITTDYTPLKFAEDYCGLPPRAMIDIKALAGDKSDNIPGVAGVGDKTAMELLCRFRSLDGVYENIASEEIRASVRKKLEADKENAYLSRRLAEIDRLAPLAFTPDMAVLRPHDNDKLFAFFKRLELKSLISRMKIESSPAKPSQAAVNLDIPSVAVKDKPMLEKILDSLAEAECCTLALSADFQNAALCAGQITYTVNANDIGAKDLTDFIAKLICGGVKLAVHDAKPIFRYLLRRNKDICPVFFDTAVAAYLLSPDDNNFSLETATEKYLEIESAEKPAAQSEMPTLFDLAENTDSSDKLKTDAAKIYYIYKQTSVMLKSQGIYGIMRDIELPLTAVLARMEHTGIIADRTSLAELSAQLDNEIKSISQQIYDITGEEFNINSPKILGEILFEKLSLPHGKKTKTGYSTNIDVLNKLKNSHPIVPLIIEYRELSKLKSTYADGLLRFIAQDGRIHTTFRQLVTSTGRLSSTEPNLQNIPIRRQRGAEIRKSFVAAEGCTLIDADYSQIELRVLAHVAGDKNMIKAFLDGKDIHAATAAQVFKVDINEVTPKMRSAAKAVNFGIVYGISSFSLAEDIGVSRAEAKEYIDSYLDNFRGVRDYMEEIKSRAKKDGFVTTLLGRRRYIPEINSPNGNIRAFGERLALNAPIQGAAADIIKIAMINVDKALREKNLRSKIVLQIHDELIIEAPADELETASDILKTEMENAFKMKAPLKTDISSGKSWFDAK